MNRGNLAFVTKRRRFALAFLATFLASVTAPGLSALTAACSLTSIPDLTSGNAGGGAPTADGGGIDGAGSDGGTADGAAPFCASLGRASTLCDDFDGDPDLSKRWTVVRAFDGMSGVALDPSDARSRPNSLLSRVEPGAVDCAYATLEKDVTGSFAGTRLDYWVRIASQADLPGKSNISVQGFGKGPSLCQVFLTAGPGSLALGEQIIHADGGREESDYDVSAVLPIGQWSHVVIDYDVGSKKIVVIVDDRSALSVPTALACPYAPGTSAVQLGIFCEKTGTTSRKVRYDDVVFDAR